MSRLALSILFALLPLIALSAEPNAPVQAETPPAPSAEELRADAELKLAGLDEYVKQALVDWKVPGLAIGIVKDGQVVYTRGFGQRDIDQDLPVTEQSVFPIGSITKGFTTALLGMLVDEGKLDWDAPVRDYLPDFELKDAYASAHVTTRDMVTHRTGVPRHAFVAYGAGLSRAELMLRLRHLEPSHELRYAWQYNNLMYMAAGHLAEEVTGQSFEELMRQRIFQPLGMTSSDVRLANLSACPNHCTGYWEHPEATGGQLQPLIPDDDWAAMSPSGAIYSNVEELCRFMLFELNGGKAPDGRQLLSESELQQMHSQQMVVGNSPSMWGIPMQGYGLGWFIAPYQGSYLVHHGGHMDGFTSHLSLLPAENFGVVVLSNKAFTPLAEALSIYLVDRLLDFPVRDWSSEMLTSFTELQNMLQDGEAASEADRIAGTNPTHKLEDYVGTYTHPGYGDAEVTLQGGVLNFTHHNFTAPLEHYHYDVFRFDPLAQRLSGLKVQFLMTADGKISSLKVQPEPALAPIEWTHSFSMPDAETLLRLIGEYEVNPEFVVAVVMQGETLMFRGPTGQLFEMVPVGDLKFAAKDLEGYGLEFSEDGQTIQIIMPLETLAGSKKE